MGERSAVSLSFLGAWSGGIFRALGRPARHRCAQLVKRETTAWWPLAGSSAGIGYPIQSHSHPLTPHMLWARTCEKAGAPGIMAASG